MKKRRFAKILVLLLALVMVAAVPMEAYAAKTRTIVAATKKKKAKAVKTGKQTIKIKAESNASNEGVGLVKFTAKKTKTYKFTFNNVRTSTTSTEEVSMSGFVSFYKKNGRSITFKQNGKKRRYMLWLTSQYSYSLGGDDQEVTADSFIPSRKVSIKLSKGQTIYIRLYYSAVDETGKGLVDLTIK